MAINTLGLITDQGWKGMGAIAEGVVSGGALLQAGSYTSLVTSADVTTDYVYSRIKVSQGGSGLNCVGVALYTAGSNTPVTVLQKGLFIFGADGNVNAGRQVEPVSQDAADGIGAVAPGANAGRGIGRALTEAASGGFTIVALNM